MPPLSLETARELAAELNVTEGPIHAFAETGIIRDKSHMECALADLFVLGENNRRRENALMLLLSYVENAPKYAGPKLAFSRVETA